MMILFTEYAHGIKQLKKHREYTEIQKKQCNKKLYDDGCFCLKGVDENVVAAAEVAEADERDKR